MKKESWTILFLLFITSLSYPHEQWLLAPHEFSFLLAQDAPTHFRQFTFLNAFIGTLSILGVVFWIYVSKTKFSHYFSNVQRFLQNQSYLTAFFLRVGISLTLFIAAFGLIPRKSIHYFAPTFFAPDLLLTPGLGWVKWAQILIAIALLFGIAVRFSAVLLLLLTFFAFIPFHIHVLDYLGFILGICLALIILGPQAVYITVNSIICDSALIKKLQPIDALFWLRLFTGLNFIYLAIVYKVLHPNLDMAILVQANAYTFGLPEDIFVLLMAAIELSFGVIILTGSMLRLAAIFLLALFIFMSINVKENPLAHSFIYGILFAFILNGDENKNQKIKSNKDVQ